MEKLEFKVITEESETEKFLQKVENYTGVRLPALYAARAKIVGIYARGQLSAGYMIVTKPMYRSLMFVPDKIRAQHPFFSNDCYEMMEVNGLWIGPAIKTPKAQFQIWLTLIKDIFLSKKKYLLLLSDSRNQTISHIHQLTNPTHLYEGNPEIRPGERTHKSVRISYTTRWNLLFNLPRYFAEYKSRQQRIRESVRQRGFSPAKKLQDTHA